jgi:hypothetical protein
VNGEERASVRIPAAVAAAMPPPAGDSAETDCGEEEEEDPGFMYLPLRDSDGAEPAGEAEPEDPAASAAARAAEVGRRFGPDRHVFWPADGF